MKDNELITRRNIELALLNKGQHSRRYKLGDIWELNYDEIREVLDGVDADVQPMRWIPVTERLPEDEKKHYWVCMDTGYQCECRWTNINHIWTDLTTNWHWHIMDIPQYSHVVAWMPLPEPWKEGEADEAD